MRFPHALLCLVLAAAAQCGLAQSSAGRDASTTGTTFKADSRVVLVDAVVTDKQGKPVHGLKAKDFVVQEEGKPQQIRGFEERIAGTAALAAQPLKLPPDTYTNYIDAQQQSAANILLFDMLNTERTDLAIARQQLLLYLSKMPPNGRVALYTLDSQLHLVHGFTENPQQLIDVAKALSTAPHPMFSNAKQASALAAMAKELIADPVMLARTTQFIWSEQQGKEESRTIATMEAMAQLARSMAAVPGRKNLVWLSGGIPFDPASTAPQMRQVASLFAATQMAVYPIDVRGVRNLGPDASVGGKEVFNPYGGSYEENSGVAGELRGVHETMMILANQTGGRVHFNSSDLSGAIADSIDTGSNYYLFAYRPENKNWNGKFRKISVKTSDPKLKIQCRPGYYAVADPSGASDLNRTFSIAMQPEVPTSTTLIIKARVRPSERTEIDTLVDVRDLTLIETENHRRQPDVLFVAAVWNDKGKPDSNDTATYRQILTAEQLQSLLRSGLQLHQEMALKPGSYQLRIGVLDRLSGKMGTLDVPLKIEAKPPQEQPAQAATTKP